MSRRMSVFVAMSVALWIVSTALPASAHLHDHFEGVELAIGWIQEPTFAGEPNGVAVFITEEPAGGHSHESGEEGRPVAAKDVQLTVEVMFGDKNGTEKMAALPLTSFAFGSPGEWRTEQFIPTRPGNYTFHIAGKIKGKAFDTFYTSGERGAIEGSKFDDVRETGSVSFPAKDPTNKDLSEALTQAKKAASVAVKKADDDAKFARLLGIVGIAVGVLALGVALARRPRKGTTAG